MFEYVRIYRFNHTDFGTTENIESLINEELTSNADSVKHQTMFSVDYQTIIMVTFVNRAQKAGDAKE